MNCQVDEMSRWQNDNWIKCQVDEMSSRQNDLTIVEILRLQSLTTQEIVFLNETFFLLSAKTISAKPFRQIAALSTAKMKTYYT